MNRCLAACSTDTAAIGHPRKSQVQDFGAVTMAATMNLRQVGSFSGRQGGEWPFFWLGFSDDVNDLKWIYIYIYMYVRFWIAVKGAPRTRSTNLRGLHPRAILHCVALLWRSGPLNWYRPGGSFVLCSADLASQYHLAVAVVRATYKSRFGHCDFILLAFDPVSVYDLGLLDLPFLAYDSGQGGSAGGLLL